MIVMMTVGGSIKMVVGDGKGRGMGRGRGSTGTVKVTPIIMMDLRRRVWNLHPAATIATLQWLMIAVTVMKPSVARVPLVIGYVPIVHLGKMGPLSVQITEKSRIVSLDAVMNSTTGRLGFRRLYTERH
jgi:hypothetical protein